MMKNLLYISIVMVCFGLSTIKAQDSCNDPDPFCSSVGLSYPANVDNGNTQPAGNNYSCGNGAWQTLITQPNAAWFYMQIATAGTLTINLAGTSDIDFAVWGPYTSLANATGACGSLPQALDCSFNPSNTEQLNISGVTVGQFYILMITNYANVAQNITATNAGTATTNCSIVTACSANTGTTAVAGVGGGTVTGNSTSGYAVTLCDGQGVNVTSNDNYSLPPNQPGESAELMYAIYNCAPPGSPDLDAPGVDACFSGQFWTAEDFTVANAGANAQNIGGGIPQGLLDAGITGTNNTIWLVPVTMDDGDNNGDPNDSINVDQNGDNCYDTGPAISIQYASIPSIATVPDCNPNNGTGSVQVFVTGTGTFTITDSGAGNMPGSVNGGSSFTINSLSNTNIWTFSLSQGGCSTTFSGTFSCSDALCLVDAAIIFNPPASNFPNNQYPPATTVTVCFDINQYNQSNQNFLHGIVPSFGNGWDLTTLTPTSDPTIAPPVPTSLSCGAYTFNYQTVQTTGGSSPNSLWDWYNGNTVTSNNGTTNTNDDFNITNPGWWFTTTVGLPIGSPMPTDPDFSWGDGCITGCYQTTQANCLSLGGTWDPDCGGCVAAFIGASSAECACLGGQWIPGPGPDCYINPNLCITNTSTGMGMAWYSCVQITTKSDPSCVNNTNLAVTLTTYADGVTGNWTEPGCLNDAPLVVNNTLCCLADPVPAYGPIPACEDDPIILSSSNPSGIGIINWFSTNTAASPIGSGSPFSLGTLSAGTYTYYAEVNNLGCISDRIPITFTVGALPNIAPNGGGTIIRCAGSATPSSISMTATGQTGAPNGFVWTASTGANPSDTDNTISVTPLVTTTYTATVQNVCGPVSAQVTVIVNPVPTATISGTDNLCAAPNTLSVTLTGAAPWTLTYAINGTAQPPITIADTDPNYNAATGVYTLAAPTVGSYTITAISNTLGGVTCTGTFSGTGTMSACCVAPTSLTPSKFLYWRRYCNICTNRWNCWRNLDRFRWRNSSCCHRCFYANYSRLFYRNLYNWIMYIN